MPLIFQKMIYRTDLKANPDWLYVFGDNLARRGLGGQAAQMRGEPNAIGVPTKKLPSLTHDAFFTDEEYEANKAVLQEEFNKIFAALREGKTVVFPEDGIGTDRAQLAQRAPKTYKALQWCIEHMKKIAEAHPEPSSPSAPGPR